MGGAHILLYKSVHCEVFLWGSASVKCFIIDVHHMSRLNPYLGVTNLAFDLQQLPAIAPTVTVLFVSPHRWDDDVVFKNCAKAEPKNKVHAYTM